MVGNEPIKSAAVVNPNDNPLFWGKIFQMAIKVTGIVKLNINAPSIPRIGVDE